VENKTSLKDCLALRSEMEAVSAQVHVLKDQGRLTSEEGIALLVRFAQLSRQFSETTLKFLAEYQYRMLEKSSWAKTNTRRLHKPAPYGLFDQFIAAPVHGQQNVPAKQTAGN
jgi:hypothetical protein